MSRSTRRFGWLLLPLIVACQKEESPVIELNQNQISYVVADNYNLSMYNTVIRMTGFENTLREPGPFTLLCPSNTAFEAQEIYTPTDLGNYSLTKLGQMSRYHTMPGKVDLETIELGFNQEFESIAYGKLYVSRWIRGEDTLLTVNGGLINPLQVVASNGVVRTVDRLFEPYLQDHVGDALAGEPELTIFYEALNRSGVLQELEPDGNYTIFAPNNAAMRRAGYASVTAVAAMDETELRQFVHRHILDQRCFAYDFVMRSEAGAWSADIKMKDESAFVIDFNFDWRDENRLIGISLRDESYMVYLQVLRRDIPAGNGVLHVIDGVLQTY